MMAMAACTRKTWSAKPSSRKERGIVSGPYPKGNDAMHDGRVLRGRQRVVRAPQRALGLRAGGRAALDDDSLLGRHFRGPDGMGGDGSEMRLVGLRCGSRCSSLGREKMFLASRDLDGLSASLQLPAAHGDLGAWIYPFRVSAGWGMGVGPHSTSITSSSQPPSSNPQLKLGSGSIGHWQPAACVYGWCNFLSTGIVGFTSRWFVAPPLPGSAFRAFDILHLRLFTPVGALLRLRTWEL